MQTTPFSLRIFVADGDPDGLRIVDKTNWTAAAALQPTLLLPRRLLIAGTPRSAPARAVP